MAGAVAEGKKTMKDFSKKTYQISLGAMLTVLSLLTLYLSAVLPAGQLTLYFLSAVFIAPMLYERQPRAAFLVYVTTSVLSLLIMPGMILSLPYILLFGHYGIGKYLIEENCHRKRAYLYKWIYYNICMILIYFTCFQVVAGEALRSLAWPWLLVGAQVAFVIFDFLYSRVIVLYKRYIRRALIGN